MYSFKDRYWCFCNWPSLYLFSQLAKFKHYASFENRALDKKDKGIALKQFTFQLGETDNKYINKYLDNRISDNIDNTKLLSSSYVD
jgi:hypothetical protein